MDLSNTMRQGNVSLVRFTNESREHKVRIIFSLFILIASLFTISPANAQPASPAPASVSITAPEAQLTYDSPTVTTSPAPQVQVPTIPAPEVGVSVSCEEDMPCWDCETMGNLQCGPATSSPALPICEEDMPCWDCQTMGNLQCGNPASMDAWASYDALQLSPETHEGLSVEYVETLPTEPNSDSLTSSQFAVPSTTSTAWHVFQYVEIFTA
ncbi:Hypothetical Protein OBI_RACECAR_45 [Arthrobacter phage Racecar]|nr:hypothetical protein PBI_RACECAR_126 [Arthrobacter phage Racecar]QFG12801.1 hypothetical protein PBI_MIMI_123 [Arthrobacter phage Mimi]